MIDLAYAMGPSPQPGGGAASMLIQLVPIALVLGIFFFLVIRPPQAERRRRDQVRPPHTRCTIASPRRAKRPSGRTSSTRMTATKRNEGRYWL